MSQAGAGDSKQCYRCRAGRMTEGGVSVLREPAVQGRGAGPWPCAGEHRPESASQPQLSFLSSQGPAYSQPAPPLPLTLRYLPSVKWVHSAPLPPSVKYLPSAGPYPRTKLSRNAHFWASASRTQTAATFQGWSC